VLERERVAREAAEKSLEERNAAFSKVEDEALALSISNANQELALREQGETVQRLELAIESARRDFESERKQVEGEPLFDSCLLVFRFRGFASPFLISFCLVDSRLAHRPGARS
jgi:hypothetical protein